MRRRKLLVALAGLAVMLCAAGIFVLWPRPDRITEENVDRIRPGMRRGEVEELLGRAPGDYRTRDTTYFDNRGGLVGDDTEMWIGDGGVALLTFRSDAAATVRFAPSLPVDHGLLRNLRWRAEHLWHRYFSSHI